MSIKTVIFDFDGTLADTRRTIVAAKQETMRRLGLPVLDEEACVSTIGLTSEIAFRTNCPDLSDEMILRCTQVYRELFEEMRKTVPPVLFDGAEEVLRELNRRGIMCTIATSRQTASLKDFITGWKADRYFSYMLGGNDTVLLKPNPEPVLKTIRDLSLKKDEVLVVGDMPYDIEMGKRAGVRTCGVTYGNSDRESLINAGADFVIDDIRELTALL